ncbi:MAG: helix-turn-helix domain-containing protein [Geminicoccaceae bacterium]
MPALPLAKPDPHSPALLPMAQELLRDALRAKGKTVTAMAVELGISRKHLSNVLNGHAPPSLSLMQALGTTVGVAPALLVCLLDRGPEPEPAPYGFMKGSIEVLCDPTEPMEDWEMLED